MLAQKDSRLFARLDLDYADHPKIMMLSDAAFRAHVTLLLYSRKYMTDGVIGNRVANRVASAWDTDVLTELQTNDESNPSLFRLESGDYYLHGYEDMQETRAEIEARTSRNSRNGARGGRPRKTQSVTESLTQSGTQKKAETETETETEVSSKELTTRVREVESVDLDGVFDTVWAVWPKKTEKKKSFEQFGRAVKKLGAAEAARVVMLFGRAYAATTETRFVPALAVWLRNERWTDELPQPRQHHLQAVPSRADEAQSFIQRLEAIDATRGSGEAVSNYQELR